MVFLTENIIVTVVEFIVHLPELFIFMESNPHWYNMKNSIMYHVYKILYDINRKRSLLSNSNKVMSIYNNPYLKYSQCNNWKLVAEQEYYNMLYGNLDELMVMHGDDSDYWVRDVDHWHCRNVCWFNISQKFLPISGKYSVHLILAFHNLFIEKIRSRALIGSNILKLSSIKYDRGYYYTVSDNNQKFKLHEKKNLNLGTIEVNTGEEVMICVWKHSSKLLYNIDIHRIFLSPLFN